MTPSALRQALRSALTKVLTGNGTDPAHDLAHADRVWANARMIALGRKGRSVGRPHGFGLSA